MVIKTSTPNPTPQKKEIFPDGGRFRFSSTPAVILLLNSTAMFTHKPTIMTG
jgi:hypothetical protein